MAITEQDQEKIQGAAKALFQERKTLSLEEVTDYLRSVVHFPVDPADVETCLARLFERQGGNLPAIELHQCMLFRRSALAYWMAQYAILVIEEVFKSEPAEGEKEGTVRTHVYLFFGVAGDEPQTGKFLGAAKDPKDILDYLKTQGIEVGNWHPLDRGAWKHFIAHSPEKIEELAKSFGYSLFVKGGTTTSIIYAL